MRVYFISGLAADRRVFRHIRLPEGFEACFLDWLEPHEKEPLATYAQRLMALVDSREPVILLGLSFGGMIAREMEKFIPVHQTILIASISAPGQLPPYYRWMQRANLHKWVPISWIKKGVQWKRLFTAEDIEDKRVIRAMARDANPRFIRWAMEAVLSWDYKEPRQAPVHIHGSADRILPLRHTKPTHIIPGGGHLMIMDRATEINRTLAEILTTNSKD